MVVRGISRREFICVLSPGVPEVGEELVGLVVREGFVGGVAELGGEGVCVLGVGGGGVAGRGFSTMVSKAWRRRPASLAAVVPDFAPMQGRSAAGAPYTCLRMRI